MPLTFANQITLARILTVPFFITVVLYYLPASDHLRYVALGIFIFAVMTDVVDGYIARTQHQRTQVGAILDPLADKVLLISSFLCLYVIGHELPLMSFPIWLVVAVISRDVMLLVGSALIFLLQGQLGINVSVWGKAATLFQVVSVIGLLLQWPWTSVFWYLAFAFTVISGLDYIRLGFNILNEQPLRK